MVPLFLIIVLIAEAEYHFLRSHRRFPLCTTCNKDLRQCQSSEVKMTNERSVVLSLEELEFLLLPQECELEEDIPSLLSERLAYQGRLKSMRIVHGYQGFTPHKINREVPDDEKVKIKKRQEDVRKIRSHHAAFVNYLNYIRCTLFSSS